MPAFSLIRIFVLLAVCCLAACDTAKDRARQALHREGVPVATESFGSVLKDGRPDQALHLITAGAGLSAKSCRESPVFHAISVAEPRIVHTLLDCGAGAAPSEPLYLQTAVIKNLPCVALRLLEAGHDPDVPAPGGQSLFLWCLENGSHAMAHVLLDFGAQSSGRSPGGRTALHLAVGEGRLELVRRLIKRGADLNAGAAGQLPLVEAYECGHRHMVDLLLASGADPSVRTRDGDPLLTLAVRAGDFGLAKQLLDKGAEVDALDPHRETALHHALKVQNRPLVSLLLRYLADPNLSDRFGRTPLANALGEKDLSVARELLFYRAEPRNELVRAISTGNIRAAQLLRDFGANPHAAHVPHHDPPLACAIRTGQTELAKSLISCGICVASRPREGQSLLALAVAHGQSEVVAALIDQGADPNQRLTRPVSREFQQLPLSKSFGWFLRNDSRLSLLMMACHSGDIELAQALIEGGARKNVRSGQTGFWPINFGSRRGDVKMMRLMLGADPEKETRKIVVDLSDQKLRVFNSAGATIFTSRISSGKKGHRTPRGTFAVTNKYREWTSTLYDSEMPYFQRLSCGDFGFHTGHVPGYPASHGCIRMPDRKARQLFALTSLGDRVIIQP